VHHAQEAVHRFGELADCERNMHLEQEAYRLQNEYLQDNHSPLHVVNAIAYNCEEPTLRSAQRGRVVPLQ
jgi:hypothetical protein